MQPNQEPPAEPSDKERREYVREYYGRVLGGKNDLQTSACCTTDAMPDEIRIVLAQIDDEILEKSYGCGSPIPPVLEGSTVLDLGCGTGRDAFIASRLVGQRGGTAGCLDYRVVSSRRLELEDSLGSRVGGIDFHSFTIRAFKLDALEDLCEDYGQVATYMGTIAGSPDSFVLDQKHIFHSGKATLVCGNTALMLARSRYAPHFKVFGNRDKHYGRFGSTEAAPTRAAGGACC